MRATTTVRVIAKHFQRLLAILGALALLAVVTVFFFFFRNWSLAGKGRSPAKGRRDCGFERQFSRSRYGGGQALS
jgi:hypothetical protein